MKFEAIVSTGEIIIREMTNEEIEQDKKDRTEEAKKQLIKQQTVAAKAALLEKLGITEEEAKLLLS